MPNLEKYQPSHPPSPVSKLGLTKQLFEQVSDEYDTIELIISLRETGVNIKELSSYLDIIYKFDAHLSEVGFNSYIHYPHLQIKIDEIRFGSWQIVIQRLISSIDADKLVIVFLALKFLPSLISSASDGIYRYYEIADKREDFLEKRDKRRQRKAIRDLIIQEYDLSKLDKKQKEKLVDILEDLYQKTNKKLPSASRLAQKSLKEIKLAPKKKNN